MSDIDTLSKIVDMVGKIVLEPGNAPLVPFYVARLRARIEELEVEVSELNRECGGYQAKLEARTELRRHNERLEIECGRLEEDRDALLDATGKIVMYEPYPQVNYKALKALKALAGRLSKCKS